MFFSTLGSLSDDSVTKLPYYTGDGEGNRDYNSAPGIRGGSALAGLWGKGNFLRRWEPGGLVFLWLALEGSLVFCCSSPSLQFLMLGLGSQCPEPSSFCHNRHKLFLKITSGKYNMTRYFSNAPWCRSCFEIHSLNQEILRYLDYFLVYWHNKMKCMASAQTN